MPLATLPIRLNHPARYAAALLLAAGAAVSFAASPSPVPVAPVVSLAGLNPGTTVERDLCLTIAAGAGAAYECGDLRLVHGLPVTRTRDRARGPVLIYNSDQAQPTPRVAVNVQLPATGTVPDSVTAEVSIAGTIRRHARWAASAWSPGAVRRIALAGFGTLPTGAHPYTVEVTNWYGTSAYRSATSDTLVVVNRAESPFRKGWWIAGLESLVIPATGSDLLWIGGDGSARIYRPAGTDIWKADALDRPDSLTRSSGVYTRHLPGGIRVRFNSVGRHVSTVTRLGDETRFHHGDDATLDSIALPVASGVRPAYHFRYGSDGYLDSIVAPPLASQARLTTLLWNEALRQLSVHDPDGEAVVYTYAAAMNRVVARTDRMQATTQFTYSSARLSQSRLIMEGTAASAADVVTTFIPAEARAVNGATALDTAAVYTRLDGPRTGSADTLTFRVNRWGAPTRITDALGNVAQVQRADAVHPALVTASIAANGFTTTAKYDALGRLERTIAHNPRGTIPVQDDTTLYEYDDLWPDFVDRVRGPSGEVTTMEYNAQGNVVWREDGMGVRTSFFYYTSGPHAGRPSTEVQHLPGGRTAVDSILYDGTLGNVQTTVSPLGIRSTVSNDAVGRPVLVTTPIEGTLTSTTQTWYDLMGRDTTVRTSAPAMPAYTAAYDLPDRLDSVRAEWTEVNKDYDDEGRLLSVSTHSYPDVVGSVLTWYTYDRAGRKLSEHQPTRTTQWVYDQAGNATETWNDRGLHTTMRYDVMNRLVLRVVPAAPGPGASCAAHGLAGNCTWTFPDIPIPVDSATFAYDASGNMTAAYNRFARVRRSYYPGGMLKTDSLRIRRYTPQAPVDCTSAGTICPESGGELELDGVGASSIGLDPYPSAEFDLHRYGMTYEYDRSGRVSRLVHPSNLSPAATGATRYGYGAAGELRTVWDARGDSILFQYDAAGRPYRTDYPGGVYETRVWDDDGRTTSRRAQGNGFLLYNDTLQYDARGKVLEVTQREMAGITARNRYSGLGTLVLSEWGQPTQVRTVEEYRGDPLGHVYQSRTRKPDGSSDPAVNVSLYHPNSSAVSRKMNLLLRDSLNPHYDDAPDTTYAHLDQAGNVHRNGSASWVRAANEQGTWFTNSARSASTSYYGADEKLRYLMRYGWAGDFQKTNGTFDEYWYDALGRRVLVRSLREDLCTSPSGCESAIERTVWAGDQVLYEIRGPGGSSDDLDQTNPSGTQYGTVGYTHAGGIDQPLGVIRRNALSSGDLTTFFPHANYRGVYRAATTRTGALHVCEGQGGCINVLWPAPRRGAYHQGDATGGDWVGSLIPGMQDASGLLYRRNRYYNPETGQFTQTDPIGLAGGLNTYGFAAGDPVSYDDPYGLCPPADTDVSDCGSGKLNDAWRTLHVSGDRGREAIRVVVEHGMSVELGDPAGENCGERRGCTIDGSRIVIRESMGAGAIAVTIAHEAAGHKTEPKALTVDEGAQNELRAWQIGLEVYNGIREHGGSARYREARSEYESEMDQLQRRPVDVYQRFRQQYRRRCPGCP